MTLQFTAGLLIGVGLTLLGILATVGYLHHKSKMISEIINERNHYKKFYEEYWEERNSGY